MSAKKVLNGVRIINDVLFLLLFYIYAYIIIILRFRRQRPNKLQRSLRRSNKLHVFPLLLLNRKRSSPVFFHFQALLIGNCRSARFLSDFCSSDVSSSRCRECSPADSSLLSLLRLLLSLLLLPLLLIRLLIRLLLMFLLLRSLPRRLQGRWKTGEPGESGRLRR
jgi:hypothetical protein